MDNLFDGLQSSSFDVVTNTMGYDASWSPSAGGETKTGRVLLKNPTETRGYGDEGNRTTTPEYNPNHWIIEYKKGVFDGLKEVSDNENIEIVVVNGNEFYVRCIYSKYDGKTFIAVVEPKSN